MITTMSKEHFDRAYTVRTNDQTRDLYNSWADTYDADLTGGGYAQPARVAAALIEAGLDSKAKVLDIGCGTGLSGVSMVEAGFVDIEGCDYSTGMLEVAAATGAYVRLFEADLHKPPIDAETMSYDAATVVGVFGFAHVEPVALTEMLRPIRAGGLLVVGVNGSYYDDGSLAAEFERLEQAGSIGPVTAELGDHIPGRGVPGWVLTTTKT